MQARFLLLAVLVAGNAALAQTVPVSEPLAQPQAKPDGRRNQKVEIIRHEDAGTIIDEVRYAGQTQSITVQPKDSNLPEYEIQPTDMARTRPADNRDGMGAATGRRVWNVLKF